MKELPFLKEKRLLRAVEEQPFSRPLPVSRQTPLDLNVTTDLESLHVQWLHANCSNCLKMCRQVKPDPTAIADQEQHWNVYTVV